MKKYLLLFTFLIFGITFSQVNSGITYQAVIYNPEGEELPGQDNMYAPVTEQDICLRFSFIGLSDASPILGSSVLLCCNFALSIFAWYILKTGYRLRS